ncbi:MAG: cupredoxin domain-containing protein [Acidimicrobiales bacterium]|nr:cupredoxin domain-containing protein [Acidimicrobiales bacterium]
MANSGQIEEVLGLATQSIRGAIATCVLSAVLTACTNSRGEQSGTTASAVTGSSAAPATGGTGPVTGGDTDHNPSAPAPTGATVIVQGLKFQQSSVTVKEGQSVTFENHDSATHVPTSGAPDNETGVFSLVVEGGKSASTPKLGAGTYTYFCGVHPSMKGQIVVE